MNWLCVIFSAKGEIHMTIKEYAKQQGISPQAVYQRLKKNKVKVESLTEKGTGEISGEGMVILNKLFNQENRQIKPIKDEQIEAMTEQIAELRAAVASKDERIKRLEAEAADLREDKEYFKQALDKAQNNLSEIKALLPGAGQPATGSGRRSFWQRLTGKGKGNA